MPTVRKIFDATAAVCHNPVPFDAKSLHLHLPKPAGQTLRDPLFPPQPSRSRPPRC